MPNLVERKTCKDCNVEKPIEEFYKAPSEPYYSHSCRVCFNDRRRGKYKKKIEDSGGTFTSSHSKMRIKKCIICEKEKRMSKDSFRVHNRQYSPICLECEIDNGFYKERIKKLETGEYKYCLDCKILKDTSQFRKNYKFCTDCANKRYSKRTVSQLVNTKFSSYRTTDFRKGLEFNLTKDFLNKELSKPCIYCGYPPTGLDRINNDLGHTIENTVPCCKECNYTRNRLFSFEEMKKIGIVIREVKLEREKNND